MAGVIAYDRPVRDFIDGLNATGHVTHTQHRKTKVAFHHNGGRLSLEGILDVWKTRPASAHFQVDGGGALGQYVKVNEYAWATGTTIGNQEAVSIELANATLAPDWLVSEVTMMEGARLAGWIFARVIGAPPTRENLKVHHDYKPTLCAGPCIDANYNRMLEQAQIAYLFFTGYQPGAPAPTPSAPAGANVGPGGVAPDGTPWGSGKPLEVVAREVINGDWGSGTDRVNRLRTALYDPALVQRAVNAILTGAPIPEAPTPQPPSRKTVQQIATEVLAGDWGNNPQRSQRLRDAGYDPTQVQAAVNAMTGTVRPQPVRLSINAVAQQVIAGQWGNHLDRKRRLANAGYDYVAVQAEVNRILG